MNGPWRILHYTGVYAPAWKFGGPPRSTSTLCEALAARGHAVTVYTTNAGLEDDPSIPTDRPVRRNGVDVRYFAARQGWMGLESPELEEAVGAAGKFDLVHVTGVWQPTSRAACRAALRARVPYVSSPRGALGKYSFTQRAWKKWPYYRLWERPYLNRAALLHYTSRMEKEECARLGLRPPSTVVPNAVDLVGWARDPAAADVWREKNGIASDEVLLLYAGRLHHKKGLDLLPEACRLLPSSLRWRIVLVGFDEDGSGARLQQAFKDVGQGERILLMPGVEGEQLRGIYSAAQLFVFPSRHENFGNVVVEALACGCPVMMSDQVGVADQVSDLAGVVVLPRQGHRWAERLRAWMESGEAGRPPASEAVRRRFSAHAVAEGMEAAYAAVLKRVRAVSTHG